LPKEVPTGGVTLKGLYIPEKTSIGWSVFGMMRDEKIWGPDAWLFRPERWLEGTPEEIREKELDIEMVFGYGKWSCLGKNVAYIELNKIFVQVCSFLSATASVNL
jgi:cytochrome P450